MKLPRAYQAALDYIFNYVDYERKRSIPYDEVAWDLERTRRVLAALGNPHQELRYVHVAGTKGKGSTAAMIESVLRARGWRTGLYTSPHLHTFRERIRVNGALLGRDELVHLLDQCRSAIEDVPGITTFEIMTVLALLHFAQTGVEWAVLEVGLGGRLDATNVITPVVSVITPISLEHTALLGREVAQIAREKAGIIKPGVPLVCAPQADAALEVILQVCAAAGARTILAGRPWLAHPESNGDPEERISSEWLWRLKADGLDGQWFDVLRARRIQAPAEEETMVAGATVTGNGSGSSALTSLAEFRLAPSDSAGDTPSPELLQVQDFLGLHIPLLGRHQLLNATVAVAVCAELAAAGADLDEGDLRQGLAGVRWPARLEILQRPAPGRPGIVVDSAHNEASAALLLQALDRYFPDSRLTLIFGASSDKDVQALVRAMLPESAYARPGTKPGSRLIVTRSRHPRAVSPSELAAVAVRLGVADVSVSASVATALTQALAEAGAHPFNSEVVICLAGSMFVAAEGREAWLAANPGALPAGDWAYQSEPPDPKWQVSQQPNLGPGGTP